MKTMYKKWLPIFLLVAVSFAFLACEKNADEPAKTGGDNTEGVITLNMRSGTNLGYWNDWGGATRIEAPELDYTFVLINCYINFRAVKGELVDVGEKTLSQITTVPNYGWADEMAVLPQHGYIWRYNDNGRNKYIKIYVLDFIRSTSDEILGATVQYCTWTPSSI